MADNIVNLNKARKYRSAKAAENRVVFGQTKGQKAQTMTLAQKVKQALDAHKRDRKD